VHLAARWGGVGELEALLAPRTTDGRRSDGHPSAAVDVATSAEGPMRFTPIHEAALSADCARLHALLRLLHARSRAGLARALAQADAFGRNASQLVESARPADTPCLQATLAEAQALSSGSHGARSARDAPTPAPERDLDALVTADAVEAALPFTPLSPHSHPTHTPFTPLVTVDAVEAALAAAASLQRARAPRARADAAPDAADSEPGGTSVQMAPSEASEVEAPRTPPSEASEVEAPRTPPSEASEVEAPRTPTGSERPSDGPHGVLRDGQRDGLRDGLRDGPRGWREVDSHTAVPSRCDIDVWRVPADAAAWLAADGRDGRDRRDGRDGAQRSLWRLGARFIRDAVSVDRPVLLRGLLPRRVLDGWSRAKLIGVAGSESFQVMQYEASTASLADAHTWRRTRLKAWLDEIRRDPTRSKAWPDEIRSTARRPRARPVGEDAVPLPEYIFDQSSGGRGRLAELSQRLFPWRAMLHAEAAGLYVGGNGSGNPFHYHAQTWNALVAGRKLWMLFPPNASFYSELHPLEWLRRQPMAGKDGKGIHAPEQEALVCEQQAGDVLFVPRLWGHGTINLGETAGMAIPFALRMGMDYASVLA
jgi:hypothetical protein